MNTSAPLPIALDPAFQFRKTKLFLMTEQDPNLARDNNASNDPNSQSQATGKGKQKSTSAVQDASITFERQYRLFGAVTRAGSTPALRKLFRFLLARETAGCACHRAA